MGVTFYPLSPWSDKTGNRETLVTSASCIVFFILHIHHIHNLHTSPIHFAIIHFSLLQRLLERIHSPNPSLIHISQRCKGIISTF